MILKLQRSLNKSPHGYMMLAYNEDRSFMKEEPIDEDFDKLFTEKGVNKLYVEATVNDTSGIIVTGDAPEQGW